MEAYRVNDKNGNIVIVDSDGLSNEIQTKLIDNGIEVVLADAMASIQRATGNGGHILYNGLMIRPAASRKLAASF
jgi:hypothetical protein